MLLGESSQIGCEAIDLETRLRDEPQLVRSIVDVDRGGMVDGVVVTRCRHLNRNGVEGFDHRLKIAGLRPQSDE